MRIEAHVDVASAHIRSADVHSAVADRLDGGRTFVIVHPTGLPRLHAHSVNAALDGFRDGLVEAGSKRGAERLRVAIGEARARLIERCAALIERDLPDVGLLAMHVDGGEVHVHTVGPCRAYLHRKRRTERITPREEDPAGLLMRTCHETRVLLDPMDLVIAGTLTAFSAAAVSRVASVLESDSGAAVAVLAQLLTEPAEQAGKGAAVVVLRAR